MINLWTKEKTPLFNPDIKDQPVPTITPYIQKGARTCIIICPGGGYARKAIDHEGIQIAQWLNSIGISAFVLDYRVAPYTHPVPVTDGKRAVRYARYLATEYGYDKEKIGILGFSAGGHLAGSVGTFDDDFGYEKQDDIDNESSKPDFMILCYPVVSFLNHAHIGSYHNLSKERSTKIARELSIEYNVSASTPPTFIWHTSGDAGVPVENSLNLAIELSKCGIPFEIHTYKDGPHGQGLAKDYKHTSVWVDACKNWMQSMGLMD